MQEKTLYFLRSALVLVAAFALSGCATSYIDANAQQFNASAKEVEEWRAAAEKGDAEAQYKLAKAYFYGAGVAKNTREVVRWTRKAAEQGHVESQGNMGLLYFRGEGVEKDQREAVRWWRKAVEQGSVWGQYGLGTAYYYGYGVIADQREAYIWWSIAKASGLELVLAKSGGIGLSDTVLHAINSIDWRNHLTHSEIRSAQKEAARRMEALESRKQGGPEKLIGQGGIVSVPKPKGANIAERVFENTWRSVVVVRNGSGQGSGVIVRPNIVATNCHVVDGYGRITVYKSNDRRADTDSAFLAKIRQSDKGKDFCLLDVDGLWGVPVNVRKYGTLGVGEDVYGLGAPQGLDLSLSGGVISQLREIRGTRFIQTDAAISPGSSGGGLFDSEGNLVGILTAKIVDKAAEGIGFAIPADLVLGY
ncbi:MAG: trypsin-like peptidase domain-containing protein [Gammaproteobacteria bacterium]|nr:trypsin-like peptidase domain-containing protein [Gammaproteobacteria bacterium]MDA8002091.1 trypsin-like peptidase domain-containing protein [Alphaproteobacteria bacterium]MDA8007418.1 trypsin-like peptidase domain-containing protein [Gammaproteobacteria bacterium]